MLSKTIHPTQGFICTKDGITIHVKMLLDFKKKLSDDMLITVANDLMKFMNTLMDGNINPKLDKAIIDNVTIQPYTNDYVYKYLTNETLDYIRNGSFQLGSIRYYHQIENEKARDINEGHSIICIEGENKHIITSAFAGYNYYIYCTTDINTQTETLFKKFGERLVKIRIKEFAKDVSKEIGAVSYAISKIIYTDNKLFRKDTNEFENIQVSPDNIIEPIYDFLSKEFLAHSLLVKPLNYHDESEVRVVFEMNKDVEMVRRFSNLSLLDYIEIIH